MTDWAKVGQELRPTIEYQAEKHYAEKMDSLAALLNEMGDHQAAEGVKRMKSNLDKNIPSFLRSISDKTADEARRTEREMVGHGRSGYVPTGNLMRSIDVHEGDTDLTMQVYPNAMAKDGQTEYAGFVEYGTRLHPVPEPFMQNTYKAMDKNIKEELDRFNTAVNGRKI